MSESTGNMADQARSVVCLGCSLACDDVTLCSQDGQQVAGNEACSRGKEWIGQQLSPAGLNCWIEGRPVELEQAAQRAAQLLADARFPLVCGLADVSLETQRQALWIARLAGAVIDWRTSDSDAAALVALQRWGQITSTLGEISERADLLVCWLCNPTATHPRFFSRFVPALSPPPGEDVNRIWWQVRNGTGQCDGGAFSLDTGNSLAALCTLQALAENIALNPDGILASTGQPLSAWQSLAGRLQCARHVAFVYDHNLLAEGAAAVEALNRLTAQLHQRSGCVSLQLRRPVNIAALESLLSWQTGFPFGIRFDRQAPVFDPVLHSANRILISQQSDGVLLVGDHFADWVRRHCSPALAQVPSIVLRQASGSRPRCTVLVEAPAWSFARPGTVFRTDGVPIPLRPLPMLACRREVLQRDVLQRMAAALQRKINHQGSSNTTARSNR